MRHTRKGLEREIQGFMSQSRALHRESTHLTFDDLFHKDGLLLRINLNLITKEGSGHITITNPDGFICALVIDKANLAIFNLKIYL